LSLSHDVQCAQPAAPVSSGFAGSGPESSPSTRLSSSISRLTAPIRRTSASAPREVRTFCATLVYTGCSTSEALDLSAAPWTSKDELVIIESLKKQKKDVKRPLPQAAFGVAVAGQASAVKPVTLLITDLTARYPGVRRSSVLVRVSRRQRPCLGESSDSPNSEGPIRMTSSNVPSQTSSVTSAPRASRKLSLCLLYAFLQCLNTSFMP